MNLQLGPWAKIGQHVQGLNRRLSWPHKRSIAFVANPIPPVAPAPVNDYVVIGGVLYAFVATSAGPKQVSIGMDSNATIAIAKTIDNLIAKLTDTTALNQLLPQEKASVMRASYSRVGTSLVITPKTWPQPDVVLPFPVSVKESQNPVFATVDSESHAFPNYLFTKQLISDQLGFGVNSWGKKNRVSKVYDSGRVPVVLQLTPNDSDWDAFGNIERTSLRYFDYVVAPVAEILQELVGNSYMVAVHTKQQPDGSTFTAVSDPTESERISGKIMIYGIKVEVP